MPDIAKALAMLAGGDAASDKFFDIAADALLLGMGCRMAGISCLSDQGQSVRIIANAGGELPDLWANVPLEGMVAQPIYSAPPPDALYTLDAAGLARFPDIRTGLGFTMVQYCAKLFRHPDGRPAGHIFFIDDGELVREAASWSFLELVCDRVGAECARRETSEQAVLESRLHAIIDNAPFSIVFKDHEGRYVTMNKQAEEWLGTTIKRVVGQLPDATQFLGTGEREHDLEVLREGRIVNYEVENNSDVEGRTFWVTKFPIMGQDGKPDGLGSIVSDITHRKQNEVFLRRQIQEAESSSDAKTRFLAAASHDLRQPLHSMELMLEILARQIREPALQELVSDITQAASIAAALLNPLLDYSRLEAGMVEPEIEVFPVNSLLRDMEVGFNAQADAAGLKLRIMPCDAMIRSDPVLLSRIVGNFVSNAIRYTETGHLLLGCRRNGSVLRIEVWDMGPGIKEEQLTAIFEEFHQIETAGRDRDKGLGLGLAIVKAQAKLLRHDVQVSSRLGRGSTFTIAVPLIVQEEIPAQTVVMNAAEPASLEGLRLLILEDNGAILRATKTLLERWGCVVETAASREEAMDVVKSVGGMFDLFIADYHLEHGDNGIDTVIQMRAYLEHDVPTIIVTADISNDSLQHANERAFPLLQKPFRPAALRAAIAETMFENGATS